MRRWYHSVARREVLEAVAWYDDQRPGLGDELLTAIETALEQVEDNPRKYPLVRGAMRRALVHRFPYKIYFTVRGDRLEVFAILHTARDPELWRRRLYRDPG